MEHTNDIFLLASCWMICLVAAVMIGSIVILAVRGIRYTKKTKQIEKDYPSLLRSR